jgi:hypothetical protein
MKKIIILILLLQFIFLFLFAQSATPDWAGYYKEHNKKIEKMFSIDIKRTNRILVVMQILDLPAKKMILHEVLCTRQNREYKGFELYTMDTPVYFVFERWDWHFLKYGESKRENYCDVYSVDNEFYARTRQFKFLENDYFFICRKKYKNGICILTFFNVIDGKEYYFCKIKFLKEFF